MQWFGKGSGNIDDRRGMSGGAIGGGVGIIIVILGLLFGKDLTGLVSQLPVQDMTQQEGAKGDPQDAEGKFVDGVLESTNQVWERQFSEMNMTYEQPVMVL